jgi:hypothetical protein
MVFNDRVYGIWAVMDVRGMWHWKDLLEKTKVDPYLLRTWPGYLEAAKTDREDYFNEKRYDLSNTQQVSYRIDC